MKPPGQSADDNFESFLYKNFSDIKTKFINDLVKHNIQFDEDIFMDTCLSCINSLKLKKFTKQEYNKYLWVSYMNNVKKKFYQKHYNISIEYVGDVCIDQNYNFDIDILFNYLKDVVKERFGESVMNVWILHFCYKKSYNELYKIYECNNFNALFKKIKRYIIEYMLKTDKHLIELVDNVYY